MTNEDINNELLYQLRIDFNKTVADDIRTLGILQKLPKLGNVLLKHNAILICQYDAFKGFVDECEQNNNIDFPLYKWTKYTINQKKKKEKYLKSFTIYIEHNQLYSKDKADRLEAELKSLNCEYILKISKYDSNPKNSPQPPKKYY
tara:strand:+ start:1068 stop:1505 length:438 start_codon:yes stop_codon:yes gene_type:complete